MERPGRIINMSSISGKYSAPFVGAYCASKHALEGMSDSLRRELMLFGIDVLVVGRKVKASGWTVCIMTDPVWVAGCLFAAVKISSAALVSAFNMSCCGSRLSAEGKHGRRSWATTAWLQVLDMWRRPYGTGRTLHPQWTSTRARYTQLR